MNSRLPESLKELMWTAHMGESCGVMGSGERGTPPTPRIDDLPDLQITTEKEVDVFNLGVAAGVAGLLEALEDAGYTILDPNGKAVPKEACQGKTYSWRETFYRYLGGETAKLTLVHGRPVTPPFKQPQTTPASTAEILPFNQDKRSINTDVEGEQV